MKKRMSRSFVRGLAAGLCGTLVYEDYLGLEAYVEHVRAHWIVLPWWPWVLLLLALLVWQALDELSD